MTYDNRVIAEPGANSLQVFIVMDVKPPGKKIILDKIASPFAICDLPFAIVQPIWSGEAGLHIGSGRHSKVLSGDPILLLKLQQNT